MNRSQAVARMQRGLGFTDSYEEGCISALQEAQRFLENGRSLPHFLKVEDELLTVPVGSDPVALPEGFIREADGESLHYVVDDGTNSWTFLEKSDFLNLKGSFDAGETGRPRAYIIRKGTIEFGPLARDAEYSLYWSYYKRSVSLAADVSNNEWLQEETGNPEALIGRAGMIIAADLRDANATAIFKAMYEEAWRGAFAEGILREGANNAHSLGEYN